MELPGGLWEAGERRRHFAFRPVTGALELELAEDGGALPGRVTRALVAALAELGGEPPTSSRVDALCVDDRRFLMLRLAGTLGIEAAWLTAPCSECAKAFDVRVAPDELPVKPAGAGFPFATVQTEAGPVRVRVPTGADQAAVAGLGAEEAVAALARRCAEGPAPAEAVDAALEAVSPEVARAVATACPACGAAVELPLDPYLCLRPEAGDLLEEVDALARAYGWSEGEVLALPRARRRRYLELVARAGVDW